MILNKYSISCSIALTLAVTCTPSYADWAESSEVLMVKPAPTLLLAQPQNPPAFSWARYPVTPKPASYTLEIQSGGNVIATYTTTRNFYLPSKAMPVGAYSWRVRPSTKVDWSSPRSFTISTSSKVFEVPESNAIKATVLAHGRSRQLSKNFLPYSAWSTQMRADRGAAFTALVAEVATGMTTLTPISENVLSLSAVQTDAQKSAWFRAVAVKVNASLRQLEAAAMLYRLTADPRYLAESILRGDEIAALDPNGPTSYINQDQVHRGITMSLLRAADLLWNNIDATRRSRWLATVNTRTATIYADLAGSDGRMDEYPFDSHGADAYGYLALIAAMSVGDIPAAQQWFDFAVRPYINSIFFWSGPEGGHASGTPYALYMATYAVQLWGPFKEVTGVNLYDKPWSHGFSKMFMHFLPPGAPGFVFGDEHEFRLTFGTLKAFASRFKTPEAAWYAKSISGSEDALGLLLAEYPLPVASVVTPTPPPNAALYPSTGWVAMHSNLTDLRRTSVYFKSSPYGSYNHAHGDQNALVIDSGGSRMLTEAGYEDYYYSPLVTSWYRQTRAHNAITYDGGIGQLIVGRENLIRNGNITAFSTTPALDFTEGDATAAYGPTITSATRKVWYLRANNVVVVLDKIVAPAAHTFEWNMHAIAPIMANGAGKAKIINGFNALCLSSITPDGTVFKKFTAPSRPGVTEDHAMFVKPAASVSAEFLVVLDIGCKFTSYPVVTTATGRTLTVNGQVINLPK